MARIEEGFTTYLLAHTGLSALIGNRIFPMRLPEGVDLPAITYERVSGPRMRSHSGPSGTANPRYQFRCWGDPYSSAKDVADQLRIALDGFSGDMGTVAVQAAFVEDDVDDYNIATKQYNVRLDAILWHAEAIA